jgi:hypothetical protein
MCFLASFFARSSSGNSCSPDDRIYEVLGFHDGAWVWYGSDEVNLPQEVYERLAQRITGKFAVGEQVYLDKDNP